MKPVFSLFIFLVLLCETTWSQEFVVSATVTAPQVTTANPQIFKQLEQDIEDLMNNTAWTSIPYEDQEKIEVSFQINILTDDARNTFKADIQMQVSRPVYLSNYNTVLFQYIDKDVRFRYEPFQPFQKSTNNYINELSSLFSFYAYLILGMDYDSFTNTGGADYFGLAQEIVNTLPISDAESMGGWLVGDRTNRGRSRYWFIENMTNSRMAPFREAYYLYHRKGLDMMAQNAEKGRQAIIQALEKIKAANDSYFNSLVIQIFSSSKREEIIDIFKAAPPPQRQLVQRLMQEIDKTNASSYKEIN